MSFDFVLFLFCLTKFTCLLFNLNMYLLHKRKHTWKTIIIVNHWEATTSSVILIYEITADSINCYAVFVKKASLDKLNIFLKTSAVKFVSLNIILKILLKGILLFPCFMFLSIPYRYLTLPSKQNFMAEKVKNFFFLKDSLLQLEN